MKRKSSPQRCLIMASKEFTQFNHRLDPSLRWDDREMK